MDEAAYRETIAVNVDGVFFATNAVVPAMKAQGGGSIVMVTSTAGVRGEAFHSHYAASKGALHALTTSLAVELAPWNIRVNAVAPGWVDTDMSAPSFSDAEFRERVRLSIPLRRIPPPEDIAGPILFLASDLARHVTGEILDVQLRKSSGVRAYDEAVQRAILKSSPLPRPERADLFQRTLTLKFRPID